MGLEIQQREREGVVILDLAGRLALGESDAILRECLQSLVNAGKSRIVLNLREVSVLDSAAVGTLTLWAQRFKNAGGGMVLLNVLPSHAALHDVLKLDTTFASYDEEQDAVNSFMPDRAVPRYDLLEFLKEESEHHKTDRDVETEKT